MIQKQTEKGRKLLAALDKREKELKKEISFLENQTEMRRMDRLSTEELLEMCPPQYTVNIEVISNYSFEILVNRDIMTNLMYLMILGCLLFDTSRMDFRRYHGV